MKIISISSGESITVRAGRFFDGHTLVQGESVDIVITGGIIRELRPCYGGIPPEPAEDVKILDLREYTVLPGLVDCHVHLALDGRDFQKSLEMWAHKDLLDRRIRADLLKTLSAGVAALRDGGDREGIGLLVRDKVERGIMPGPRIRSAGMALGKRGMYGSFLGPGLQGGRVRDAVKSLAGRGVDQIKVLVSGVVSFKSYRRVGGIQFGEDQLKEIVWAAHSRGIRVMAHASSDEAVRIAVRSGVDSLEHGYFISEQSLEAMAAADIPWVPTLAPVASQVRGWPRGRYSPEEREVIQKTYLRQQRMVKKAADMGVKMGVGTDAGATGVTHGEGFLKELLLLEEAGLSRQEILRAATVNGSFILGLEREMGMIRPGLPPCLTAVRGNPLDNLNLLKNIEFMILPRRG